MNEDLIQLASNQDSEQCHECNSVFFVERILLKKLSAIKSPTGRKELIPMVVYVCANCFELYDPD